jgi:predicted transcriptional regulator of viral defense system
MARSTYISENLTQQQIDFVLMLDEEELDIFTLSQAQELVGEKFADLNEIVENLVHKKILSRVERGKYCRTNFKDELAIGTFVVQQGAVAYWSALNRHGLTEQFANTIFIQTTHLKKDKTIFGISYKFIKIAESKRIGVIKEGYGSHTYWITDIDKTIVDCFDLPQYSGGYAELLRSFAQAKLSSEKMIQYCKAIKNIAVTKRMGYLAELLDKNGMKTFIRYAKEQVNTKYNLFDPQGIEKGEFVADWKLRLNISKKEILDITNKQY